METSSESGNIDFNPSKCDFELKIPARNSLRQNAIPFLYALRELLCIHCLTSSSFVANRQFIPCLLFSKHYPNGYAAKIVVNSDGIHLTGENQPVSNSLLICWSCILRWQQEYISTLSCVFRVYIVGLIHPSTPHDPEASSVLSTQHFKHKDDTTCVMAPATHSFEVDGFAHDASLDFCCLAIFIGNRSDCDIISTAFQTYALCDSKDRGIQRPLLLFVNKISGQAKAEKILSEFAGPLLSFSGCTFDVFYTGRKELLSDAPRGEYRGHACDYIRELPLSKLKKYRALVYVSGDGVLHELVNGLFSRDDVTYFPPFACIPAGSGNAMASAICYRSGISTKRNLLRSCAILLSLPNGSTTFIPREPSAPFQLKSYWQIHKPMILEADNWAQPRLCSVAVTWGFISEVDLRSDFMRFLGSVRFQIVFAFLLIKLRKYRCEFSFLLARHDEALIKQLRDTFGDQLHVGSSNVRYLPSVSESLPDNEGWIRINGSFVGLNFLTISHLGADGVYFAEQGISSDHIVVHLMPPNMSRGEMIRLMTTTFSGHPTECGKTGISLYVKAFRITLDEESSKLPYIWSIDGESFDGMRIFQGELQSEGYPILALPRVPRNPINHAPNFLEH
nr:sphingosine kinase 1 [Hymenolepis microstoma]